MLRRRLGDEAGVGLVELLVAMVILAIIGGVVTNSVITGMQATRRGQARVYAVSDVQKGLERLTREVRAADPVDYIAAGRLRAEVYRDGARYRYTYEVSGGDLRELRERYDSGTWVTVSDQVLVADITNAGVFSYAAADGSALTGLPLDDTDAELTSLVEVTATIVRSLPEQDPVTVTTAVTLRND